MKTFVILTFFIVLLAQIISGQTIETLTACATQKVIPIDYYWINIGKWWTVHVNRDENAKWEAK